MKTNRYLGGHNGNNIELDLHYLGNPAIEMTIQKPEALPVGAMVEVERGEDLWAVPAPMALEAARAIGRGATDAELIAIGCIKI